MPKKSSLAQISSLLLVLTVVLLGLIFLSTALGYMSIPYPEIVRVVLGKIFGAESLLQDMQEKFTVVIMQVRLPRILTATVVGSGLALSGVVFQGILLNPLADPYTLGVSAGAAFGASIALLLEIYILGVSAVPLLAFAGALCTLFLVIYLSSSAGGVSSNNLILSGVIVTAIISAGISFLKYLAQERVSLIIFWLLGSFTSSTWTDFFLVLIFLAIGTAICIYYSRDLNLLSLGNRTASSLGVNPDRTRLILLIAASLLAAVCVSVSGIIGFIGLLVPHMMRAVTGPDHLRLIPVCLLAGGVLLLGADTVTRVVLPSEVPIGVLTALIGGPFFCYVFRKRQIKT